MTAADHADPEYRLGELGYQLQTPTAPAANYLPVNKVGNLLYISGQLSTDANGVVKGILGAGMNVEAGRNAAELSAVNILTHIAKSADVPLIDVKKIAFLTVLVASTPTFTDQHLVANGASDLFAKIFGDKGRHARAAFGVASLPLGAAVEIAAIIEV